MADRKGAPESQAPRILDELRREVELVISANKITASAFGLEVIGDPNFVGDLRAGKRDFKASTIDKARDLVRRLSAAPAREKA